MKNKIEEEKFFNNILLPRCKNSSIANPYSQKDLNSLVRGCWDLLEPEVKQAYISQSKNPNSNQDIVIGDKSIKGLRDFAAKMNLAQVFHPSNKIEEAIERFQYVDKHQYSTENPVLSGYYVKAILEKHNIPYSNILNTIKITTTTDKLNHEKQNELDRIATNILIECVTNKSSLHSRALDNDKIDENGRIHGALLRAVTLYAKDNFEQLKNLTDKELKFVGKELKTACNNLDLSPSSSRLLFKETENSFKEINLNNTIAMAKAMTEARSESVIDQLAKALKSKISPPVASNGKTNYRGR